MKDISQITLRSGAVLPVVGLGTGNIGSRVRKPGGSREEVHTAINAALECGYRHIDTATLYQNEEMIGEVLHEWLSSGDDDEVAYPLDSDGAVILDMTTDLLALWSAMEEQVDAGRAKDIGLSNFNSQQIEKIMKVARIPPAILQVEVHAYLLQRPLRALCQRHNITVCGFMPLGAPHRAKETDEFPLLLNHPVVTEIAGRINVTPAQVLLCHLLQHDIVVIPKSANPQRIKKNCQVFHFELTPEDMAALDALDRGAESRVSNLLYYKGVLIQLVQMTGGAQTPFYVRLDGDCPATEDLARLFGIPFRYFQETARLMDDDPTILAVSAHNTFSFPGLGYDPSRLLRGVMPPQWGWMATRRLIKAWVPEYWGDWDYWVMALSRSKGLDVVFPEVSRSLHAGSSGTHIDGYSQAMIFSRQSAIASITNLTDVDGLLREAYSTKLASDVARATPITLTSPKNCGPNLIPAGQVTYIEPLIFARKATSDPSRGLNPGQIHENVKKPDNHTAVPHNDELMEAISGVNMFRRSRELRTSFRVRRPARNILEEVQLKNIITGVAVLGLDLSSLFLNKGMLMPLEIKKRTNDVDREEGIMDDADSGGSKLSKIYNTASGDVSHDGYLDLDNMINNEVYVKTDNNKEEMANIKNGNHKKHPNLKAKEYLAANTYDKMKTNSLQRVVKPLQTVRSQKIVKGRGGLSYTYYEACVVLPCFVSDPLLDHRHFPHLLGVAADVAQKESRTSHNTSLEFTVQDYNENPYLFNFFLKYN
ncbi:Aldo-keto reductase family 1 member B1-like 3, partial [Homarus americanus]